MGRKMGANGEDFLLFRFLLHRWRWRQRIRCGLTTGGLEGGFFFYVPSVPILRRIPIYYLTFFMKTFFTSLRVSFFVRQRPRPAAYFAIKKLWGSMGTCREGGGKKRNGICGTEPLLGTFVRRPEEEPENWGELGFFLPFLLWSCQSRPRKSAIPSGRNAKMHLWQKKEEWVLAGSVRRIVSPLLPGFKCKSFPPAASSLPKTRR